MLGRRFMSCGPKGERNTGDMTAAWPRKYFYAAEFFRTWKITLRITLGSASPCKPDSGIQRIPAGAAVRAGTLAA